MTERDALYFGALLHDIGKFIERAKLKEWSEGAWKYVANHSAIKEYAHKRYSAKFVADNSQKFGFSSNVEEYILRHHPDRGLPEAAVWDNVPAIQLLRLADQFASAERETDTSLAPGDYHRARLQSPFYGIALNGLEMTKRLYQNLAPLTVQKSAVFAESEGAVLPEGEYATVVEQFLLEVKLLNSATELYPLMQKWLHSVPAQSPISINGKETLSIADISLFDHSRMVAALSLCFYDEWKEGTWQGKEAYFGSKEDAKKLDAPCLLLRGDVSGIQAFIFNIVSKKAAKQLKARSFLVQMLGECVVNHLISSLDLKPANVVYNGGGSFYIIVPACKEGHLEKLSNDLAHDLLNHELYLALGWTKLQLADFESNASGRSFGNKWQEAFEACEKQKKQRYKNVGLKLFEPQVLNAQKENQKPTDAFDELTQQLTKAKGYKWIRSEIRTKFKHEQWQKWFEPFGVSLQLLTDADAEGIALNDTSFAGKWKGFRFYVNQLPRWTACHFDKGEPKEHVVGNIIEFASLADQAQIRTGTAKIAVLKMDVDNLGRLFKEGLPPQRNTIARIANLSRTLQWFFEGFVNEILNTGNFVYLSPEGKQQESGYKDNVYVIFSGGDDFFAVGAWDAVYAFAERIRSEFKEFVQHSGITLSASLTIVSPSFPVVRFAEIAEERLSEAKDINIHENKNAIHVLDENISWAQFEQANHLSDVLDQLVKVYGAKKSVIGKTQQIAEGYGQVLSEIQDKRRFPVEKIWRLGYLFRDIRKLPKTPTTIEIKRKDLVEIVVNMHEHLLLTAFANPTQDNNPALFSVGARKAELLTRNASKDAQTESL